MKSRTLFLAAVLSLCLGAVVSAQQTTVEGTVVSNSGGTLVLNTAEGSRTFLVDGQTSVPATLAAGTRVTVEYQTTSDNQLHAFKVTPATAGSTTPSSSASMNDMTGTTPSGTAVNPQDANATGTAATTPSTTGTETARSTTTSDPYASGSTVQQPSAPPAGTTGSMTGSTSTAGTSSTDTTSTTADTGNTRLPATASPLPLMALVGTLALAAGLALRLRHA